MAEPSQTETADTLTGAPGTSPASQELANGAKVTRAKATPSGIQRRPTRAKSAQSSPATTPAPVGSSSTPTTGSRDAPASAPSADRSPRPANVEIYQGGAETVEGDNVTITQGGASIVNASSVQIRQGGIANAQADDITVSMGGVALARADRVSVEMGGMGISFAREAHLTQGAARSLIAQDVHVDQSLVGTALAGRVTFNRPSGIFLLIAGRVEGPVQALLDWRGAIAFGAAVGLVVGLLRRR